MPFLLIYMYMYIHTYLPYIQCVCMYMYMYAGYLPALKRSRVSDSQFQNLCIFYIPLTTLKRRKEGGPPLYAALAKTVQYVIVLQWLYNGE